MENETRGFVAFISANVSIEFVSTTEFEKRSNPLRLPLKNHMETFVEGRNAEARGISLNRLSLLSIFLEIKVYDKLSRRLPKSFPLTFLPVPVSGERARTRERWKGERECKTGKERGTERKRSPAPRRPRARPAFLAPASKTPFRLYLSRKSILLSYVSISIVTSSSHPSHIEQAVRANQPTPCSRSGSPEERPLGAQSPEGLRQMYEGLGI